MSSAAPARWLAVAFVSLLGSGCATTQVSTKAGALTTHVEPDQSMVTHPVQKGQTLYRIARAYGLSVEELMDANRIDDPRELKAGELLYVPGARERRAVPEYDAPEPEAQPRPVTASSASAPPEKKPPKVVRVGRGSGVLEWPLRGVLYARFGKKGKEPHDGIDLAAPAGQSVKTAAPGTVLFAGEQKGYGLIVIVEHDGGLITLYAHNRDLRVKTGQKVRAGQVVATVGDSGRTSGPHLHFEVRKDGVPVDPLDYLGAVPPA
jgi:murein DD-endopeptidase MepM/ murein hydrolase activator NlpD